MTREFFITSDMIRLSSPQSPICCPVGLALQAGGVIVHEVGFNFISCSFLERDFLIPLPPEAFEFLRRHDAGAEVVPTSFSITFLEEAPHPLPSRFNPKPMPKAPPLPVQFGVHPLLALAGRTLGHTAEKVSSLLPVTKREPIVCSC